MFDIGAVELLLIFVVAVLVIGKDDMPVALRMVGRWVGKLRKLSAQFRSGLDTVVRDAELEDMEKRWKEQNERIMREHPEGAPAEMEPTGAYPAKPVAAAPTKPQEAPRDKATELKIIAEKQRAAAEEAERAAREAELEAQAAKQADLPPDTDDKAPAAAPAESKDS
ncbi:Sec-independent protein translocase protein TatB [Aurantiacibacter sediminis]|uniref:Sec-independent protein translocase protein TatB n=1 Tax=Aurantiacibacter sediminis TaxID=2793064 RepID=A0ABS0N685_9SPHN|nr:Sec-independent protein translocase protein TatB [Aurantiacibacter sediminis]MBH5323332.1 twin-arginine translocase subunit TatB [Aurantiacibacter sediminis]